jgi:hypothetical protein
VTYQPHDLLSCTLVLFCEYGFAVTHHAPILQDHETPPTQSCPSRTMRHHSLNPTLPGP